MEEQSKLDFGRYEYAARLFWEYGEIPEDIRVTIGKKEEEKIQFKFELS